MSIQPSRLGIGTYLGELTDAFSQSVKDTILYGTQKLKIRTIDTAINYRYQRSEQLIGEFFQEKLLSRNEVFLSTKGGFIPFQNTDPLKSLGLKPSDIVEESHCIHPKYIEWSLHQSLKNLKTNHVDIFFLHNPEFSLGVLSPDEWESRIIDCFEFLEKQVTQGSCGVYGIATWQGLRVESKHPNYISLQKLLTRCQKKFSSHHFKAIQLPVNPYNREFTQLPNQQLSNGKWVTVQDWAQENNFCTLSSAPLLQGQLIPHARDVMQPTEWNDEFTASQNLLSWTLRLRGITSTLLGTSQTSHLQEAQKVLPIGH